MNHDAATLTMIGIGIGIPLGAILYNIMHTLATLHNEPKRGDQQ